MKLRARSSALSALTAWTMTATLIACGGSPSPDVINIAPGASVDDPQVAAPHSNAEAVQPKAPQDNRPARVTREVAEPDDPASDRALLEANESSADGDDSSRHDDAGRTPEASPMEQETPGTEGPPADP